MPAHTEARAHRREVWGGVHLCVGHSDGAVALVREEVDNVENVVHLLRGDRLGLSILRGGGGGGRLMLAKLDLKRVLGGSIIALPGRPLFIPTCRSGGAQGVPSRFHTDPAGASAAILGRFQ